MKSALLATLSAIALSACAAGPDYVAPIAPPPAAGAFVTPNGATTATATAMDWWRLYHDPVLDGLVADALAANTDVRVAVARLDTARAALRGAKTDREPQVGLGASGQYGRASQLQALPGFDRERGVYDIGLDVRYEVDLAGRVRRNVEAARGDVGAAQADADAVRVSIVAATTRAYVDAASAAERLAVAERIVALLDRSTGLTTKQFEAGRATKLDAVRFAALRDQRAALVPAIMAERQAALFRLATLTGRTPAELPAAAGARTTTPRLDQPIPIGDGAALFARRPDVRAAERRLAAAAARITRARQREGQIDFLTVLDAERTFADADADLASADARIAGAQVDLFRALGGGWQNARLASNQQDTGL